MRIISKRTQQKMLWTFDDVLRPPQAAKEDVADLIWARKRLSNGCQLKFQSHLIFRVRNQWHAQGKSKRNVEQQLWKEERLCPGWGKRDHRREGNKRAGMTSGADKIYKIDWLAMKGNDFIGSNRTSPCWAPPRQPVGEIDHAPYRDTLLPFSDTHERIDVYTHVFCVFTKV